MWGKLDRSTSKLTIQAFVEVISQRGLLQYFTIKHVRCFYFEDSRYGYTVKLGNV